MALSATLSGCGATNQTAEPTPSPTPEPTLSLLAVSQTSVKADYAGALLLSGTGFDPATTVAMVPAGLNGADPRSLAGPALIVALSDPQTLSVKFAAPQSGNLIAAGNYSLQVRRGSSLSAALPLNVRPVLLESSEVGSLPKLFLSNGGFLNIYMVPSDSGGHFIAPGTQLAGVDGLGHANFQLTNVTFTPLAGGTPLTPEFAGVNDVLYDPVSSLRPLAVAMALDQSGSIATTDPTNERIAEAKQFVAGLTGSDLVQVDRFQGSAEGVTTVVPFTSDPATLATGLTTLDSGVSGGTPLFDAMVTAVGQVAALTGNYTRAVIILTDGVDNGSTHTQAQAIAAAVAAGVPIYTIGLGDPSNPTALDQTVLQAVAAGTGGQFLFATDPASLPQVFTTLAGLLKSSYELDCGVSFNPPLTATGTFVLNGDVTTTVDGTTITTAIPPVDISIN